jgi:hypothetical protein
MSKWVNNFTINQTNLAEFTPTVEDFYQLKLQDLIETGGGGLMQVGVTLMSPFHIYYQACYMDSVPKALQDNYPDYNWQPWRFYRVPGNHF